MAYYFVRRRRADRAHRPQRADLARPRRADGRRRLHDGADARGRRLVRRWRSCCWPPRSSPRWSRLLVGAAAARLRGPYLAGATLALAVGLPALATKFSGFLGGSNGPDGRRRRSPPAVARRDIPARALAGVDRVPGRAASPTSAGQPRAQPLRPRVPRRARRRGRRPAGGLPRGPHAGLAFVVSAACAGLAGGLLVVVISLVAPGAFPLSLSLALLTGVVLGGTGQPGRRRLGRGRAGARPHLGRQRQQGAVAARPTSRPTSRWPSTASC